MAVVNSGKQQMKSDIFDIPFVSRKISYPTNCETFVENDTLCRINRKQFLIEDESEQMLRLHFPPFRCGESNCNTILTSMTAHEIHYASFHRFECLECKIAFPSQNFLDAHVQDSHNLTSRNNENSRCGEYDCPIGLCEQKFDCTENRNEHIIKDHKYPPNFKFFKLRKDKNNSSDQMDTSEAVPIPISGKSKNFQGKYIPRVPQNICFGRGSVKAFKSRKAYHPTLLVNEKPNAAQFQETKEKSQICMMELQEAL